MKKALIICSVLLLSSIMLAGSSTAQTLEICRDQGWSPYFSAAVTDAGGELALTCLFHTSKNCKLYGEVVNESNDFLDSSKFTNHFYLYQGDFLVKDMGLPSEDPVTHIIKTNETETAGTIKYTMKIVIGIAAGVGDPTGENYGGKFRIVASAAGEETGETGAALVVALGLPVNATIIKDVTAPQITWLYPANNTEITMHAPTLRAKYHDIFPGTGVSSAKLKIDAQTVTPDKWNSTELHYNIRAPLSEGTIHTFTVNVTDGAGNSAELSSTFTATRVADTTAPAITYFSPVENETVGYASPTFTVRWNDSGSGINIGSLVFALDGSQYSVPFSEITDEGFTHTVATQLINGPHWWSVQIKDYAGLADYKLINFTVLGPDIFAPSSHLSIVGVDQWNIILSWTASDNPGGSGLANVTIYYAVNTYRDEYGAYKWNRWRIFSNQTNNAMFDTSLINIQTGDTIYFRCIAADWNGNIESKWEYDTNIIFEAPKPQPVKAEYTVLIVVGMIVCAAIGWVFLFIWIKREEIRFVVLRREIKKKAEEIEKEKEKEEEQE